VGVRGEQGPALGQPVFGELVEAVARAAGAGQPEQFVDGFDGARRVGALVRAAGRRGLHHLGQTGVDVAEQGAEAARVGGAELGAVAVPALDPGVQGVAVVVDDGDGAAGGVGDRRGDGQAEVVQALGGPVLAGDGVPVGGEGVHVLLEEVRAAGGGEAVAAVEEALGDRDAGEWFAGVRVAAQEGADGRCGAVRSRGRANPCCGGGGGIRYSPWCGSGYGPWCGYGDRHSPCGSCQCCR
jgi:hypothetical protein